MTQGEGAEWKLELDSHDQIRPLDLEVVYTDARGSRRFQTFHVGTAPDAFGKNQFRNPARVGSAEPYD